VLWSIELTTLAPAPTFPAELKPETARAWDNYIEAVNAKNFQHLVPGSSVLSIDETPTQAALVRAGNILVSPSCGHVPMNAPLGLIHYWAGAAFIPNVTLSDVLSVVRDYKRYKGVYHPYVADSSAAATYDSRDRFRCWDRFSACFTGGRR
jgi:hypothetical protein